MNTRFIPRKARAVAPLLCATALLSTPAFAQDVAPQTAPPPAPQAQAGAPQPSAVQPVIVTPPKSATVDIPPVVSTVPEGQAQASAAEAKTAEKPAPRAETRTSRTTRVVRTETRAASRAPASKPAPAEAPKAATPQPEAAAPRPQDAVPAPNAPAPVAPAPDTAAPAANPAPATVTTSETSRTIRSDVAGLPLWAWVAGGIAALVVILGGIFAMTRRRREYEYDEPYVEEAHVEPAPVVEPVSAAPVMPVVTPELRKEPEYLRRTAAPVAEIEPVIAAPDEVNVQSAPSDEVAELTGGDMPVAERPWLELAMRPVRSGTNVDEALVEIELTVGNAGAVPAKDVRISTFLLSGDPGSGEMEKLLIDPPAEATADPVTIRPGEGKRVDATLALLKSQMGDNLPDSIRPVVVADARYTLPDGSEGRTSASFVVGVTPEEGGALEPIELARASMHDNVGAELHGEPQHA